MEHENLETLIATLGTLDHHGVDWPRVQWTAYLIHQHLRYDYPGPIHDLHQRLMIVPPERHGGQRLVTRKLEIAIPGQPPEQLPPPGIPRRVRQPRPLILRDGDRALNRFRRLDRRRARHHQRPRHHLGTYLLQPRLQRTLRAHPARRRPRAAAAELAIGDAAPEALAARINAWVHAQLTYEHGITGVRTTAAEALALQRGVCQDYAHIMLAICRLCGLPARYVSGHLLGEGGSHAWVEVLAPRPNGDGYVALPFDPTHGNRPGLNYITVATGRDYGDVAPTSGTFRAPFAGQPPPPNAPASPKSATTPRPPTPSPATHH
ncbi:MAG: transglutaminase family protein [Thermomicrobiales bacterium]